LLFGKSSFENVIVMGHVQDENGQKMSKSKGNAVDPFDALETYGADAIRWYFYTCSAPWLPKRFSSKLVTEGQRKFMGTLWNTYAFFVLYANIDGFDATKYQLDYEHLGVMDRWLISRLQTMIAQADQYLDAYAIPEAARALSDFVDEMSNWYVRRSRERFWAKGMEQDKINAYMTLYTALTLLSKAAAPMIPFMTEAIYQNLVCGLDPNAPQSIHLCDYPVSDATKVDEVLEKNMENVLRTVVMGRACRNNAAVKNRQPLPTLYVKAPFTLDEFFLDIIKDELNVKEVEFRDDISSFINYRFKPQLRTVGPKFGKLLGKIQKALTELDGLRANMELTTTDKLTLDLGDETIELGKDDLLITVEQTAGYVTEADATLSVVLDTNRTPELIQEGFVLELISKIQTMRKDADFEVMDRIYLSFTGNDTIQTVVAQNQTAICEKVLANEVSFDQARLIAKEWNINGENVTISVEKV
jgi:isoleucyl-tRNA synthetase